jgi:hypothetical protein
MNQNDFHDSGLRVFGLHPLKNGKCTCGNDECGSAGKHPISSNWQHTPDWSDDQFETMHEMGQFDTGYGVLVDGLLVVDVDARNGGVESFAKLCKALDIDLLGGCGLAVSTGSGNGSMHLYFKMIDKIPLSMQLDQYRGIDFKSSGFVVGPGSLHKSGIEYEVIHGDIDKICAAPPTLLGLLKKPDRYRATASTGIVDVSVDDVRAALAYIDPDTDYDTWIRVGMAINHALNGDGFDMWDDWSKNGKKYQGVSHLERHWHSFGKSASPVTLGTLLHYAEQAGYQAPFDVEFKTDIVDDEISLLDISGIDLKRPPGFVGEVTKWINSQSFYPRENLAVATALTAIGNIGGMRYKDDRDNFTANLFSFCVAGSSTGKESIQQCFAECMRAAGISAAVHGHIKSEQEIIRNLTRHQAAFYCIDEMGIVLKKILNAGSKSGASYLEGVIGSLMSIYSKAASFLQVGGDIKEEIKSELKKEIAACYKKIESNEDKTGSVKDRLEQAQKALDNIDSGIDRPFLSLIGFTTPVTFNGLVDYENATNGFLSRSMIFDEPETNPMPNKKRDKPGMPDNIKYKLSSLWRPGEYTSDKNERIEHYGDKSPIKTTQEASEALDEVLRHYLSTAEEAKENGLEAVPRRGYELTAKISFILAIPEGVRTIDHVRWAFALASADINRKMRLAYSNMEKDENPANSVAAKIQSILTDSDDPILASVLINRCRPAKRILVEDVIKKLVESGRLEEREGRQKSKKYSLTNPH